MNIRLLVLLLILPLRLSGTDPHWESFVSMGDSCSYLLPDTLTGPEWILSDFDDSGWLKGKGGVGYADRDDSTVIDPAISVFCRYSFDLPATDSVIRLILDVDFDDAFAAYLNGVEIGRYNLSVAESPVSWDQPADGYREANLYQGLLPMRFLLGSEELALLQPGKNVLAIQVHNSSVESSDMSSNVFLHAEVSGPALGYPPPPLWFEPPYHFEGTKIPLMVVNTGGQTIPDEPRITARMGLVYRGPDTLVTVDGPFNEYDGQISIELRGESSMSYDKKSYSFETQTDSGSNNNVSLLGLPPENDFVLNGPYSDKSQIRNAMAYNLFTAMGHYSPRTRFIELVIDGDYKGLYLLLEKIKRDRNRVNIKKITPADTGALDITGGYILRIDKISDMQPYEYWESGVTPPVEGHRHFRYQYFDPSYDELLEEQRSYIRNWLNDFELAFASSNFTDPETGYRKWVDVPSLIDMMILNEFTKDVDAFRLSHYFYKDRDDVGGKIVQGPPWDYNLTFGNNDFAVDIQFTEHLIYTKDISVYWWERAMEDPWFRNELYCRWNELRDGVMSSDQIAGMAEGFLREISDAVERNYERWPVLGIDIWPNYYVGETYEDEINYLTEWMQDRLIWLDTQWARVCEATSDRDGKLIAPSDEILVYPNPSDLSSAYVSGIRSSSGDFRVNIYSSMGVLVHSFTAHNAHSGNGLKLPDLSYLPKGIYILELHSEEGRQVTRILKN